MADANEVLNTEQIQKLINDEINKAVGGITRRIDQKLDSLVAAKDAPKPVQAAAEDEKLSLKALQARLDAAEKRAAEATARQNELHLRSEVSSAAAKVFGADNPHLSAYVDKAIALDKRFVRDSDTGITSYKGRDEFGDVVLSLDEGMAQLAQGEWKVLKPTRNSMPPTSARGLARGVTVSNQIQQTQQHQEATEDVLGDLVNQLQNAHSK